MIMASQALCGRYDIVKSRDGTHVKVFFTATGAVSTTCVGRTDTVEAAKALVEKHASQFKREGPVQ
jgi:hypothetical protein